MTLMSLRSFFTTNTPISKPVKPGQKVVPAERYRTILDDVEDPHSAAKVLLFISSFFIIVAVTLMLTVVLRDFLASTALFFGYLLGLIMAGRIFAGWKILWVTILALTVSLAVEMFVLLMYYGITISDYTPILSAYVASFIGLFCFAWIVCGITLEIFIKFFDKTYDS